MIKQLTLTQPDDWHLHLRDGNALETVVPHSAAQFGRAIIMPNLTPPVTTTEQACAYRKRILAATPPEALFDPLMTLYLTDTTKPDEIRRAMDSGQVFAAKLYPAGATTNSAAGVSTIDALFPVFDAMQEHNMPLLVHGEVTDPSVDVFDREALFIEQVLAPLVARFTQLKVVMEHITTAQAVAFVTDAPPRVAATLTPQHLLMNRNSLFQGGLRPHNYCLPVLKRESHRQALLAAATSGNPKFFLGTDSAPHARNTKETACGCAGCYSASYALEHYATAFEQANALDHLEGFASHFGADFYGLARNERKIQLVREPNKIVAYHPYAGDQLVPLLAGTTIPWQFDGLVQ